MKLTFIILLISQSFFTEFPAAGIYVVIAPVKKIPCLQKLEMLVGTKRVCVSKKPIISTTEIEYVTEILYDPIQKLNYINLGLSSRSVSALNETNNFLPHAEFAVVVDHEVICTFTIQERFTDRFLRIGSDLELNNLTLVRNALKKMIAVNEAQN